MTLVLLITQGISFVFAIASIISTLYLNKDNELFMVMPVTFNQLFISKIMMLYVTELIFNILYIFPILITFGILGSFSYIYFLLLLVFVPVFPILPIALAAVVSIPIMFVVKFFKNHSWFSIISLVVSVAVVFVLYMELISGISGAINIAEKQIATGLEINSKIKSMGSGIFMYSYLANGLVNFKMLYWFFIYLAISLAFLAICFLLIKPFYYKIATISLENTAKIHSKPKKFKKRTPFMELLTNEFKIIFRSPSYIFQFFLFPLFMPLIVFTYDKLLINIAVNQAGQNMIFGSHILILLIVALMSNLISSIAISKEGPNFYLTKTSPVHYNTQIFAKLMFNAIITFAAIIITTITTLVLTDLSAGIVLLSTLLAMILCLGHICHSFDMDLQNPVLDWYDNSEISTLSKSTTKSMIYALVLAVIMFALTTFAGLVGLALGIVIGIIYLIGRIHLLKVRIFHYFRTMEV